MMKDRISDLFSRMDTWRHLPSYQLERRADIFFSLYLPEVLEAKLGFAVRPELVPEFPVRIGTIYPRIPTDKSFKIDYIALSAESKKVVFVELKTDELSRRPEQDKYLLAAQAVGLSRLLGGLLDIFRASNAKRKYFHLLGHLEAIGLLRIPAVMKEAIARPNLKGVNEASRQIEVTARATESLIVYVQPNGTGPHVISFHEFAGIVRRHKDPVSRRFADSLGKWAETPAGQASSG